MKFKIPTFNLTCGVNLLTRQRALFKSKRRGDSSFAIATRFTCQRALCNRGKRQGDSQRVIDTDLVHGSSTTVQNRVQLNENLTRSYEKLLAIMNKYVNLCETMKGFYVKELIRILCENNISGGNSERDLGNESKVNRTCNLRAYNHPIKKQTNSTLLPDSYDANSSTCTMQTKHINVSQCNTFIRSRSRCITRSLVHAKRREREPSRIPMKKLIYFMSKNKKRRHKIKSYIRQLIPKSSALYNLLSTRYRKYVSLKPVNVNMWKFRKPCRARKLQKFIKKETLKTANLRASRTKQHKLCTLNNPKVQNTNKCNMQRMETANKRFLFVCGDIELNPGPINISHMTNLTTRLARIGRKPANIVGDGNCFFRSISHQLYGTEVRHPQIRALAIQHLINNPEHFVEYNTDQSWLHYLQSMSTLGTWADHIIIQAVANTNNLRINITESAPNFSESTTVSSIYAQSEAQRRNLRDIYVGHLDELHYVSTTRITPSVSTEITYQTNDDKSQAISAQNSQLTKTSSKEAATMNALEKRKQYMKEYMKQKRKDSIYKKKEIERKKLYNTNYKNLNPEKIKESWQKPLQHTENQILRIFNNHVKKPLTITERPIRRKLKNPEKRLVQHTEN